MVERAASPVGVGSTILAALAALASVASFWPRKFPSTDPTRLGDYAVTKLAFTQLTVLDTLEVMLVETAEKLDTKARRLKWALVSFDRWCRVDGRGPIVAGESGAIEVPLNIGGV